MIAYHFVYWRYGWEPRVSNETIALLMAFGGLVVIIYGITLISANDDNSNGGFLVFLGWFLSVFGGVLLGGHLEKKQAKHAENSEGEEED